MVDRPFVEPKASIRVLAIVEKDTNSISQTKLRELENTMIKKLTDVPDPEQAERLDTVFIDKLKSSYPKHTSHQVKTRIDSSRSTLTDEQVEEILKAYRESITVLDTRLNDKQEIEPIQWQMIARTEEVF